LREGVWPLPAGEFDEGRRGGVDPFKRDDDALLLSRLSSALYCNTREPEGHAYGGDIDYFTERNRGHLHVGTAA
jgi:hypothetical protein